MFIHCISQSAPTTKAILRNGVAIFKSFFFFFFFFFFFWGEGGGGSKKGRRRVLAGQLY